MGANTIERLADLVQPTNSHDEEYASHLTPDQPTSVRCDYASGLSEIMWTLATGHQTVAECHFGDLHYRICSNWRNRNEWHGERSGEGEVEPVAGGVQTARREGAITIGATAVVALALGALAMGALAIGNMAIGQLTLGRAKLRRGQVDELMVARLTIRELTVELVRDA